ncbi:fungal-specific transcription factor domain-containing protein [Aspergillus egyptiacus]|nr:fungal-specific transcription factor domain-containing protein [Aspergillus egyptiacus]
MEDTRAQQLPPRRRRPALSCTICRRRKLKCDRSLPCGQCIKSKTPGQCVFTAPKLSQGATSRSLSEAPPNQRHASDAASPGATGMYVFDSKNRITQSPGYRDELQELRNRVRTLEQALAKSGPLQRPESLGCDSSSARTAQDPISDQVLNLSDRACFRGKNGRTRYRGRSSGELTLTFFRGELRSRETQEQNRVNRGKPSTLREMLPPRNVADELLNLYLSTFEIIYRILLPSFAEEYEAYWATSQSADTAFIAKLLVLMAAASCFISPTTTVNGKDTLHDIAVGWVLGVQSWVSSLQVSATAKFDILQIQCLLVIARQALAVDGDVVWVTSGSLVHTAMVMGMHRDPLRFSKMTPFWAEMRRRLWVTILELDLQASMDIGVSPSIDLDQYDCDLPSNCHDSDMSENMLEVPVSRDEGIVTQSSFQIMLARSLPLRIRIAKAVNSLNFDLSYDEALQLGEALLRLMNEALALFATPSSGGGPSFARSFMLFLMQRTLLALHRPFSLSISLSPKYSYSRKICLESALEMLTQFEFPPSGFQIAQTPCLGHIGGGMFRDECFHAAITVCVELSLQIAESGSSSAPSTLGGSLNELVRSQQDVLLRVLERAHDNFGRRISPKGNGCKAFVFLSMALAAVKARLNGEDPLKKIEQSAMRAVKMCQQIIRGLPYEEIQRQPESEFSDFGASAMHTPDFSSSISDISFDPVFLLSANPIDFSPLDFSNIFDTSYYRMPELWDPNFLAP